MAVLLQHRAAHAVLYKVDASGPLRPDHLRYLDPLQAPSEALRGTLGRVIESFVDGGWAGRLASGILRTDEGQLEVSREMSREPIQ